MKNYIICFKNGTKMRVIRSVAEGIINREKVEGYATADVLGKNPYKQLVCLHEILYIQPEELEMRENSFTYTPNTSTYPGTTTNPTITTSSFRTMA